MTLSRNSIDIVSILNAGLMFDCNSKKQYLFTLMHSDIFFIKGKYFFHIVTRWTKQAFSCSKFLSPWGGGQLWANTAFEGSQFYSIRVPKFYSWVNVISVYAYNDLG